MAKDRVADHSAVSSQSLTMYMKPSSKTIWMMRKRPARTLAICKAQALSGHQHSVTQLQVTSPSRAHLMWHFISQSCKHLVSLRFVEVLHAGLSLTWP